MKLSKFNTVVALLSVVTVFDFYGAAKPATAVGLAGLTEDNTLIFFDSASPSSTSSVRVSGPDLTGTLLGIDYRPADGQLYGIGNANNVFTIDPDTGAATRVNTLSTAFTAGGFSGVDFNPAADALRLTGTNDQNFRIPMGGTGATLVDGNLNYAAGSANAGISPTITASAYTNSFPGPSAAVSPRTTQLYDIDSNLDILALQNPPNDGTLQTVGSLGVNFGPIGGFDIFSPAAGDNTAYAAFGSPSGNLAASLYTINLTTGAASSMGQIGSGYNLIGLAAEPVPEPSAVVGTLALGALGTFALLKRKQKQNIKA